MLDALPLAFALFDATGRLAEWNPRLAELKLFPKRLLRRGTPLAEFRTCDAGLTGRPGKPRLLHLPKGGTLEATARRVAPKQLLVTYEDVTEAQRTAERLELVERAVSEGIYDWDIAADRTTYSDRSISRSIAAFGRRTLRQGMTGRDYFAHIHPDDRERFSAELLAHFKGAGEHFESEYRFGTDGRFRWFHQHGTTIRDAQGRAVRMIGATADITARKEAELALERAHVETAAALERQTATAEILKVIASSPSDAQPVFDAIAHSAHRLFNRSAAFQVVRDGMLHIGAIAAFSDAGLEKVASLYPMALEESRRGLRAMRDGRVLETTDILAPGTPAAIVAIGSAAGFRSIVTVPLLRGEELLGQLSLTAEDVRPRLDDKQIGLLKTFADQAMIAIENTRLFNETREALERQTATAKILEVIASSPSDVQPVFDAIVEGAARLFGCKATIHMREGEWLHINAIADTETDEAQLAEIRRIYPVRFDPDHGALGRAVTRKSIVEVSDTEAPDVHPKMKEISRRANYRSFTAVPLVREGTSIGVLGLSFARPGRLDDKQKVLVRTFADQAVIAIENVRLFNETKEALERQTATADILKVIARSPSDAEPVFDSIAQSAHRLLSDAEVGIALIRGDKIELVAAAGLDAKRLGALRASFPRPLDLDSGVNLTAVHGRMVHYPDATAEDVPSYTRDTHRAAGIRAMLGVPLLREGSSIGGVFISRTTPGAYTEKQIELLRTFADQAVIAIENARLFNETKEALERQTATAEILKVIASSPTDVQPVFEAIVENAARLMAPCNCGINMLEGDWIQFRAAAGATSTPEQFDRTRALFPIAYAPDENLVSRAIAEGRVIHVDTTASDAPAVAKAVFRATGARSITQVPLMRRGKGIGTITVRSDDSAFRLSDRQLALIQTFAAQAVIAIENVRLFNETREALEQQRASAEVLNVISNSVSDAQPVFEKIVESCERLFATSRVGLNLIGPDGMVHAGAYGNFPGAEKLRSENFPHPVPGSATGATISAGQPIQYPDALGDADVPQYARRGAQTVGFRAFIMAPLLSEGRGLGAIFVGRETAGSFSEKESSLLKTFADQAVIAIENTRLFNETREALERQTATADILQVIASSPSDVQPVFDAIAASAVRLCDAVYSAVVTVDDGMIHIGTQTGNWSAEGLAYSRSIFPMRLDSDHLTAIAIRERRVIVRDGLREDPSAPVTSRELAVKSGYDSLIIVPMRRGDDVRGAIVVTRISPFSEHQTALLNTFADQAVIAIENVRLFNETKEALERQTATAEILRVISSSPTDVQPVLDAMAASAANLCDAADAAIWLREGDALRFAAHHGSIPNLPLGAMRPLTRNTVSGRAVLEGRQFHIADLQAEATEFPDGSAYAQQYGYRAALVTPLMREGAAVGAILIRRVDAIPFDERQIGLVQVFASQAVIAIENVRLFNELKDRTDALTKSVGQLTALGEVGQAISSTLDLDKVLPTIVSRAVQLMGLDGGAIYEYDEASQTFALRGGENLREEILELNRSEPIRLGDGFVGRAASTRAPVQVADLMDVPRQMRARDVLLGIGARALLAVPLLTEGHILGALAVIRNRPGEFSPEAIGLLETFATQSAIAIQNARLFREIEDKSRQLEEASRHKSQFLASMSHELRTPLNAILGFNEMILAGMYGEVPADMQEPLADIQTSGKHLLRLINNVLDLAKIEAGRMELALADYSVHDTVESVRSTLRPLAAEKGLEFTVTLPDDIPLAHGDSGRITQCLVNLAGNSLKFTKQGRVEVAVAHTDGLLTFRVSDTGIGIAPEKIGSLFTEFKQTDATIASEYGGSGLGLSIVKKFVEMHGGRIWAESELGKGSNFIFEIPLRAGEAAT